MKIISKKMVSKTTGLMDKYLSGKTMGYKEVVGIITPILVDQAFIVLMSLFNTAMISSSGVAAVSAVNMVDSLNIFLINVFVALATGGTVMVAQYKGSKNQDMVSKTATQAVTAVGLFSAILGAIIILFYNPVLNLLFGHAEADVLANAKVYLIGSAISYPFLGIYQAVVGGLRGVGETKPCLGLSFFMNVLNTILNVIFITILNLGVVGLIISVISARFLGMAASLVYMIKYNETIRFKLKNALRIEFGIFKKIMFIGIPFAAEQIFFNGGKLLTQTFIVQLGTFAQASNAIGNSITLVFLIGPNALAIAIVTVVGQSLGSGNVPDAKKYIKSFMGIGSIFFILTSLAMLPLFPLLMKLFNAPDEIIPIIFTLIIMSAIGQPILWPASFIIPAGLRAAGDSTYTTVVSLISMWTIRVILGYVLGITMGIGIIGVWLAMIIEWIFRGALFSKRFRGDKWYSHKLI